MEGGCYFNKFQEVFPFLFKLNNEVEVFELLLSNWQDSEKSCSLKMGKLLPLVSHEVNISPYVS